MSLTKLTKTIDLCEKVKITGGEYKDQFYDILFKMLHEQCVVAINDKLALEQEIREKNIRISEIKKEVGELRQSNAVLRETIPKFIKDRAKLAIAEVDARTTLDAYAILRDFVEGITK